jgi:RNA polymerase sigma-70 factor (ECF subfamily)
MHRRRDLRSVEAAEEIEPSDDVALLEAVVRRDPAAVRRLLDEVAPIVYGYLYARVGGDEPVAEDLLQETLLEAVRSAPSFRGDSALSTWLCAIARRRLARHYERERRSEAARAGLRLALAPDPDLEGDALERQDEVVRALGRIPPTYRQVLVLKYLDGLTVEEIAGEMGRSRVQVQSLLQRARDRLRQELGEDHD